MSLERLNALLNCRTENPLLSSGEQQDDRLKPSLPLGLGLHTHEEQQKTQRGLPPEW